MVLTYMLKEFLRQYFFYSIHYLEHKLMSCYIDNFSTAFFYHFHIKNIVMVVGLTLRVSSLD